MNSLPVEITDRLSYIFITYIYDKSNRLLKSEFGKTDSSFDMTNAYDGDGNITYLKRMGASGNVIDSLNYNYYTSTDKLNFVTGSTTQFTYDANGNVTGDTLNHIFGVKYDYRNLLKEFRIWRVTPGGTGIIGGNTSYDTYLINYLYDEAGSRFCKKIYKWSETTIDTISNGSDNSYDTTMTGDYNNGTGGTSDNGYNIWRLQTVIYYVHDVSGKEIAIYNSNNLQQWNVFGADNVGKIDSTGAKYFYLKDNLGTIRAILDTNNTVIAANDFDAWGYPLDQRSYDAQVTNGRYKFTSKERDVESALDGVNGFDYFGFRFYNSKIGRWNATDLKSVSVNYSTNGSGTEVGTYSIRFDPDETEMFMHGVSGKLNNNTLGYGMVFLHELLHTGLGISQPDATNFGDPGPVENEMNKIREQLGSSYGQRLSYTSLTINSKRFLPFDKDALEVMKNTYQKYIMRTEQGFNMNDFMLSIQGTKYIEFEKK